MLAAVSPTLLFSNIENVVRGPLLANMHWPMMWTLKTLWLQLFSFFWAQGNHMSFHVSMNYWCHLSLNSPTSTLYPILKMLWHCVVRKIFPILVYIFIRTCCYKKYQRWCGLNDKHLFYTNWSTGRFMSKTLMIMFLMGILFIACWCLILFYRMRKDGIRHF